MKRSILVALLLALAIGGWVLSGQVGPLRTNAEADSSAPESAATGTEQRRVTVRARLSHARPLTREVVARGRTEAVRQVNVSAETDGRVIAIPAAEGARVAKGAVLLKLAVDDRLAREAEAEALVRQREIEYRAAQQLSEKGYRARTQVAAAEAALDAAKAALTSIQIEIARTVIRAPIDGVIEKRRVEVGDYVKAGDPIALLVDEDPFLVVADVSERDVGRIAVGMPAGARLITGESFVGRVRYVATMADAQTRTFRIEIEVANQGGRLHAGVTSEIRIPVETIAAHFLSPALLTLDDDGRVGVRAVDADGVVHFHAAEIADDDPDGVWLAGLPESLTIITVGQDFVRQGDRVAVTLEEPGAGS